MKSYVATVALLASAVAAQTTTTAAASATSMCAAQNILETCLGTTQGYVSLCDSQDYGCLCDKYGAMLTCFNQCPNDSRSPTVQQQKALYCNLASMYPSSSDTATATALNASTTAGVANVASTTAATTTATTATTAVAQTTAAAAISTAAKSTASVVANGGVERATNAGGMVVAVVGLVAALL